MKDQTVLAEIYIVFWPNGKVWSDCVSPTYEMAQMRILKFFLPDAVHKHVTPWMADSLWKAYEEAGFKIVRQTIDYQGE